jgi:hypothetical protein
MNPSHDPLIPDDCCSYERLGGILFVRPEAEGGREIEYQVDFVENPNVAPSCALPLEVRSLFSRLRVETEQREEDRWAKIPSFLIWEYATPRG